MEQKDNTGAIFKNDFKKTETQPDYKGKCLVDGKEKEIEPEPGATQTRRDCPVGSAQNTGEYR